MSVSLLLLLWLASPPHSPGPATPQQAGGIRGSVTTLGGEVFLPGATVVLTPDPSGEARTVLTDERGRFAVAGLRPGRWRLAASLAGFQDARREVVVEAGREVQVSLDLALAGVTETVVVRPEVNLEIGASLGSSGIVDAAQLQEAPIGEISVQAALPLVPGVVRGPDGISVKGGRPTQSVLMVGNADVTDPAVGDVEFRLPGDAVAQIEVLPNPYAVEYGRFSSGVTVIEPRKGGNAWRLSFSDINPAVRVERGKPFKPIGVESFQPRVAFSGPLVTDRLFIAQSVQLRYTDRDIRSRPQDERVQRRGVASFTRLDWRLNPRQTVAAMVAILPERRTHANLATFDPPEVTANTRHSVYDASLGGGTSLGQSVVLDTLLHVKHYSVQTSAQGVDPMVLAPAEHEGNFFNSQERLGRGWQWRETLSATTAGPGGAHFLKAGLDLEYKTLEALSQSRPVLVPRPDGTLARQIVFDGGGDIRADGTDVAAFVQDRWQPREGLVVEAGLRGDRDGVLRTFVVSPRAGVRATFGKGRPVTLGGGVGRFVERTPLAAGAFEAFESRLDTRYDEAGIALGPPTLFTPRLAAGLEPARARTWHVEYHQQVTPALSLRASVLERRGSHELVVDPEPGPAAGTGWLTLRSTGRSRYREGAVGVRYASASRIVVDLSYVRASALADASSLNAFFATIRDPIVREPEYGRADADIPHRLIGQFRTQAGSWRMSSVLEVRNGLPFSALDVWQDYVGQVNGAGRLHWYRALDLGLERRVRIWKLHPYVGVQVFNALNRFNPRDVQRNLADPTYGWFYNSDPIRVRLTVRGF
ncbi:MAG: Outer rane receptor for ferrienterochelin and colicin [Acidobacteria bacterium]|nr:Outer rane receptor for ferrienterochelin and colicin [Acidobacteriota bacterium]